MIILSVFKFSVPVSVCLWSILFGACQQKEFGVVSVIYLPFIGTSQNSFKVLDFGGTNK